MNDARDERALLRRVGPLAVLVIVGLALFVPQPSGVEIGAGASPRADGFVEVLDRLSEEPPVLIAFDPDFGTFAEIRPTVRGLLGDLLDRGADLAFVSLTPEGRALGSIELARLAADGVDDARITDLGFRTGAEAALLELVREPLAAVAARGDAAEALLQGGLEGIELAIVVGGNDLGPRSWIEQVRTRAPSLPIVAVTPTVLLPELTPYLATGQLEGLLGTIGDGAAYRAQLATGPSGEGLEAGPRPLAILAGVLVAVVVLAQAALVALTDAMRGRGPGGG
jgi:hypothetical protein